MGAKQIIILAISAIAAIGFALILRGMLGRHAPAPVAPAADQSAAHATVQVLVAKRDLQVGTRLATGDLGWQPWPATALNSAFITDGHGVEAVPATPGAAVATQAGHVASVAAASVTGGPMEALYGAMVRTPILANEPISNAKLLRSGDGGYMAVVLQPGKRAVAVPVSVSTAAGGFILPGDRVDVIQARAADPSITGGHGGFAVAELLRNVRVLAIDQAAKPAKDSETMVGAVATLEVSESDAKILTLAKAQGEVVLALRPFTDGAGAGESSGVNFADTVHIVRDGQASEVMVAR